MADNSVKISRTEERSAWAPRQGCLGVLTVVAISLAGFTLIVWLGLEMTLPEGPAVEPAPVGTGAEPAQGPGVLPAKRPAPPSARPAGPEHAARDATVRPVAEVVDPAVPPGPALTPSEVRARVASVVQIVAWDRNLRPVGSALGGVVSRDGWVLTNSSVADAAYAGFARLRDGRILFVEGVAAQDPGAHAALVKLNGTGLGPFRISGVGLPASGTDAWTFSARDRLVVPVLGTVQGRSKLTGQLEGLLLRSKRPVGAGSRGGPVLAADGTLIGLTLPDTGDPDGVRVAPALSLVPLVQRPGALRPWASADGRYLTVEQAGAFEEAWAALQQGKHAEALKLLRRLRADQAGSAWYWHTVASLQAALGKDEDAVTSYRAAVRVRPKDGLLATSLAGVLADLGRHEEAIEAYREAIDANRRLVHAHTNLGHSLRALGRFQQAVEAYDAAIGLDSRNAAAYLGIGTVYHEVGVIGRAILNWKLAARYGKDTPVADEARRRLREAAGSTQEPEPPEPGPEPPEDGGEPR